MNFWNSRDEGCVGSLQFTPDTLGEHADFILKRLQQELGIKLLRMRGGTDPATERKTDYQFFYRPETIEYFEDDIVMFPEKRGPALAIGGIPFYLSEDERADAKHAIKKHTPKGDWIDFAPDCAGAFRGASGHYAFRRSMITDMFANPEKNLLAIQTPDCYRSFVPMENPHSVIDEIARHIPQLVKSDAPPSAYPLYYDPAVYPPERRHHVNIIMRI